MSITDRVRKHLYDIVEAGNAISAFTSEMVEDEFLANELVQSAVERKFEIKRVASSLMLLLSVARETGQFAAWWA